MPTKNGRMTAAEARGKLARQSKQLASIRRKAREASKDIVAPVVTGVVMKQVVGILGRFLPQIPGLTGSNRAALIYAVASLVAPTLTKDKSMGRAWRDSALNLAGASIDVMAIAGGAMRTMAAMGGARQRMGQVAPIVQLRGPQPLPQYSNARTRARSRFAA